MSTDFIENEFELMKEDLIDFIENEPLDMLDEFPADEIASSCIYIARCLTMYRPTTAKKQMISNNGKFYYIKVNNNLKGFVSVSNDGETGVSRTEYYPFFNDEEDGAFAGLCSLASMINEAWYHCNS